MGKVKEVKHVNSKEDIAFLRKFGMFVLCVVLGVVVFATAKCSHDKLVRDGKTIDHNGDIVDSPISEEEVMVKRLK